MAAENPGDPTTVRRLYGRARGKKLRSGQQVLLDELLPRLALPEEGALTSQALFGDDRPLHLEIGFGAGEHLAYRADLLPDHGFIGCEPFVNGMAAALARLKADNLGNVRLHMGDALDALARVPDGTLSFVYLLHPDPWPKSRHAKRRMINDGPIRMIAAKLRQGGELRFGTDHPVYVRHALMVLQRHGDTLEWLCRSPAEWLQRPSGWPVTRYEAKARREGREVWHFRHRRR